MLFRSTVITSSLAFVASASSDKLKKFTNEGPERDIIKLMTWVGDGEGEEGRFSYRHGLECVYKGQKLLCHLDTIRHMKTIKLSQLNGEDYITIDNPTEEDEQGYVDISDFFKEVTSIKPVWRKGMEVIFERERYTLANDNSNPHAMIDFDDYVRTYELKRKRDGKKLWTTRAQTKRTWEVLHAKVGLPLHAEPRESKPLFRSPDWATNDLLKIVVPTENEMTTHKLEHVDDWYKVSFFDCETHYWCPKEDIEKLRNPIEPERIVQPEKKEYEEEQYYPLSAAEEGISMEEVEEGRLCKYKEELCLVEAVYEDLEEVCIRHENGETDFVNMCDIKVLGRKPKSLEPLIRPRIDRHFFLPKMSENREIRDKKKKKIDNEIPLEKEPESKKKEKATIVQGWGYKKGDSLFGKGFKRRYFVLTLDTNVLQYGYPSAKGGNFKYVTLNVKEVTLMSVNGEEEIWVETTTSKRVWKFKFENKREHTKWFNAFSYLLRKNKGRSGATRRRLAVLEGILDC